ncbi:MAG: TolC family protein [Magnetococcales bacterium]|nr:TolC family protein [Magnetococcales bacterium]
MLISTWSRYRLVLLLLLALAVMGNAVQASAAADSLQLEWLVRPESKTSPTSAVPTGEPWTLKRVIQKAGSYPAIRSKQAAKEAAKADLEGAEWQRYPTPGVQLGRDSHGANTTTLSLEQPLWTGGRITAAIDAAEARHGAAGEGINESQQEILLRVIAAYVEATREHSRQEILIKQVRRQERLLEMIARRVQTEASPTVDRELAETRMHLAVTELSVGTQAYNNAMTMLSELAGEPVTQPMPVVVDAANLPPNQDTLLTEAVAQSPTLARMKMEENAARADVDSKRSVFWPQVVARYESTTSPASLGSDLQVHDSRMLMMLSSQVGAGLSNVSGLQSAQSRLRSLELDRESTVRDLRTSLNMDWDTLVAARLRLRHAELSRSGTAEVFDSYTRQYVIGRKSWLDVMNAVREDIQAELAVEDTQAEINVATLRIQTRTNRLRMDPSQ